MNTVFFVIYEYLRVREPGYLYRSAYVDVRWYNTDSLAIMKTLRELNMVPECRLSFKFQKAKYNTVKNLILFKKN